jgi:dTDP-4-amino-4,6-dideoxygalactose transaminase
VKKPPAFDQPIYVTRPLMPALPDYVELLEGIWRRHWLTNKGQLHDELEAALCSYLRVKSLSLVANGTLGLALTCNAFELEGEVVTTPFTSPATVNALHWCGLQPVFADIDDETLTIDPSRAEQAINANTSAVVGVHLYGMPCAVDALARISKTRDLRIIYDGAHTFGTEIDGKPILEFGDATILSFHATKLFNTAEGGAVVTKHTEIKQRIDLLRTLGIKDEVTVALPGINARMNELEAALGLANLAIVDRERLARGKIAGIYRQRLAGIDGLKIVTIPAPATDSNFYFVIRLGRDGRLSRDRLHDELRKYNVYARRYFYPLCSNFSFYRELSSAAPSNLPVATQVADEILCLPLYGALAPEDAHRICDIIAYIMSGA